jgi:DNA mismatch repair protein MutS
MMKQYLRAKRKAPDAVLLFRMGDFYELFHDDARLVSRLLGLTLTSRSKGEGAIPMAGFPYKSVGPYIRKLLKEGHKVAICEQIQDPRHAKGIVDRDIVRVVTPGTLTEDEVLSAKDENHLAAVVLRRDTAGLAWIDLSTGRFRVATARPGDLEGEMARIAPSEILLPEGLDPAGRGAVEDALAQSRCMVTLRPDWTFDPKEAAALLRDHFGVTTLQGFGLEDHAPYTAAAGAVLHYLRETQKTALGHIASISLLPTSDFVLLDGPTRRSLELVTSTSGRREGTLLGVLDHTLTAMGGRMLKAWILNPLQGVDAILHRQKGVAELVGEVGMRRDLGDAVEGVHDIERIAARISCGRASPRDLVALGRSLARLPAVSRALAQSRAPILADLARLDPFDEIAALLERALRPSPPLAMKEGGIIRAGYNDELDELLDVSRSGKGWIARFQAQEMKRTGITSLKIGYNRVFGYYIEVTHTHRDRVPSHYVRKQTLKNAERYVTDALKEHEVKVLTAVDKARDLEYDLFIEIRDQCARHVAGFMEAARAVARADVLLSLATVAAREEYVCPRMVEERVLHVRDGRHPVLENQLDPGRFVPNDVAMDPKALVAIITGPNMAGKSTYIRQVALLVLLAQIGSFVPAAEATVGVADRIFTRTGASDEIARGLSTFMVEMNETSNILNNATDRSLVILDEVGRGTSTFDGVSIAWAVTEHLSKVIRARTLFATHYHELTELSLLHEEVRNYHVSVKEWGEKIVFVHKIAPGGVDKSYGIHVARLAGIPRKVLDRAREILEGLEGQAVNTDLKPAFAPPRPGKGDSIQLTLFTAPPSPTLEKLRAIDIDDLSPLDALLALKKLKDMAEQEDSP